MQVQKDKSMGTGNIMPQRAVFTALFYCYDAIVVSYVAPVHIREESFVKSPLIFHQYMIS